MLVEKIVDTIKINLSKEIKVINILNSNEIYVEVEKEYINSTCGFIYTNIECSLISLFACDERCISGSFGLYYTFAIKKAGIVLVVKTTAAPNSMNVESITPEIPGAGLYEMEIRDMFGITFLHHPDDRPFVHHGNWPEGVYPLNRDFKGSKKPPFADREQEFVKIDGTGVFEIPVGPVHAGIIEPGHFRFSVAGEPIINLEAKLFYVHKGIEKLSEDQSFQKVLFISERISGDETFSNSLAYCQAVEKIAATVDIPERAQYSRVILAELERLYNHIGDIAGICVDVAYGFANGQFAMMRRWCQMLNEQLSGSRFLRSTNKPGGLRKDFILGNETLILSNMEKLKKEFNETVDIIKANSLFIDRVENTGVVKNGIANDLNAVGPAGRAAGIQNDIRKDFPYEAYGKLDFKVPAHFNGDVNCRMNVKIEEVNESIGLIVQALERMPSTGAIIEPVEKLEPYRFAFGLTESPRGENCHFVMSGENNTIFRYKIRTPSFCNWPVLCHAVKGNIVPDFPLINKSFNLSYSGNDL